jgi:hypothetical protein
MSLVKGHPESACQRRTPAEPFFPETLPRSEGVSHVRPPEAFDHLPSWTHIQHVAVGKDSNGRIQVDVVGGDHMVYQTSQASPNGGWSGSWMNLGRTMQQLNLLKTDSGALLIFALGHLRLGQQTRSSS